jgi:DNA-binding FadR family transcriptional regulator
MEVTCVDCVVSACLVRHAPGKRDGDPTAGVDREWQPMNSNDVGTAGSASLWKSVVRELVQRIVSGRLTVGERLPPEPQMGVEFGVSRTVVRESIRVLIEKGLIRIDRGRGTLVNDRSEWRQLDSWVMSARLASADAPHVLSDIMGLRLGLESELAALAAERIAAESQESLQAAFDRLETVQHDPEEYAIADSAFHEAIAEAAGNSLAPELFRQLSEPLLIARRLTNHIPGGLESAHADHRRLLEVISAGEADAARETMRRHILFAQDHLDQAT